MEYTCWTRPDTDSEGALHGGTIPVMGVPPTSTNVTYGPAGAVDKVIHHEEVRGHTRQCPDGYMYRRAHQCPFFIEHYPGSPELDAERPDFSHFTQYRSSLQDRFSLRLCFCQTFHGRSVIHSVILAGAHPLAGVTARPQLESARRRSKDCTR